MELFQHLHAERHLFQARSEHLLPTFSLARVAHKHDYFAATITVHRVMWRMTIVNYDSRQ